MRLAEPVETSLRRDVHGGAHRSAFERHDHRDTLGAFLSLRTWEGWRDEPRNPYWGEALDWQWLQLPELGEKVEPPFTQLRIYGIPLFRDDEVLMGRAHVRCTWTSETVALPMAPRLDHPMRWAVAERGPYTTPPTIQYWDPEITETECIVPVERVRYDWPTDAFRVRCRWAAVMRT